MRDRRVRRHKGQPTRTEAALTQAAAGRAGPIEEGALWAGYGVRREERVLHTGSTQYGSTRAGSANNQSGDKGKGTEANKKKEMPEDVNFRGNKKQKVQKGGGIASGKDSRNLFLDEDKGVG